MDEIQLLRTLDPVTAENVDAFPALEVFEQLSAQLAEVPAGAARTATPIGDVRRRPERGGHRLALRSLAGAVAVAAVALAASLALTESVAPSPRWAFAGEINPTWAQVPGRSSPGILTCPSATTCYATGPKSVEVTRDGGHTWHHALAQGGMLLSRVACSSAADCAFLESGPRGKPLFVETADTGKTWTSHPGPAGLSMDHQLTKRSVEGGTELSCPSAATCTVVASGLGPSQFGAFVTEDGGRTWSASAMPSMPFQVQCFPDARCVSVEEEGASYSTDNGLKWSPAWTPGYTLNVLSCSNSQTCMAASWPGGEAGISLVVSDNGGESWSTVEAKGLPAGKAFTALDCATASECWMAGDTRVNLGGGETAFVDTGGAVMLSSADGGRTWKSTKLPKGIVGIFAISCPTPTTCFAVASRGPEVSSAGLPKVAPSLALLVYTAPRR